VKQKNRGFTFIELMMTLAIMAVLALLTVPIAKYTLQRTQEHDLRRALIEIRAAIDAYKRAAEQGRVEVKPGETGYPHALDELTEGVVDQRSPVRQKIYFLRRFPPDPFYSGTSTKPSATWGLRSYASPPDAPAEGRDVFDVYSTSVAVGLNGVPYRQW
jgi:general secretion pathway protein G